MAPKRAQFLCYGDDGICIEVMKFIQDAGVILDVRDIGKDPLSEEELYKLVGHLQITHFLNTLSDAYTKYRFDKRLPEREEIIRLMAKDHTLIRKPIIKSSRLLTVGCDRRKIAEMLQISPNGQQGAEDNVSRGGKGGKMRHSAQASK